MDSKHPNLRLGAIALLLGGLLGCQQDSSEPPPGNTLYLNGKIHTQDGQRSQAEAMVVQGGKFTYVGSREGAEALKNGATQVVDLQGRMVLPGLHDNHIHLLGTVALDMCDLDGQSVDLDQLAAKIGECPAGGPGCGGAEQPRDAGRGRRPCRRLQLPGTGAGTGQRRQCGRLQCHHPGPWRRVRGLHPLCGSGERRDPGRGTQRHCGPRHRCAERGGRAGGGPV